MVRGLGKFLVLKNEDLDKYLDENQESNLYDIVQTVDAGRIADGKVSDRHYFVINQDESYALEIIAILKKHGHWEGE